MSLARLKLVVIKSLLSPRYYLQHVAVDQVNNYIYTAGSNSSYQTVYVDAFTYNASTNTLTLKSTGTTSGELTWAATYGLTANYRGVAVSLCSGYWGFKVYTFDGTTLVEKAMNNWMIGSPKLAMGITFRKGTKSDDILLAQNTLDNKGRLVSFSWDGSTTITNGVLGDTYGTYARTVHANANYFVSSGHQTAPTYGTFSISAVTRVGQFGDQNVYPYVSPYIDRVYTMEVSNYVKVYDLSTSATLVTTLYPNMGTVYTAFEDSNNVVYLCGQYGIAAYTYSGSTYTLRNKLTPPDNTTFYKMEGDSLGNLFVTGANNKVYVIKAQWYQTNPMIFGQHY